jgi:exopolysaccharide production protein ExoY
MLSRDDSKVALARLAGPTGRQRTWTDGSSSPHAASPPRPETVPIGGTGKRLFDLAMSVTALVVLAPLFICIALLILISDGRPVLISQRRVGHRGRPFECLKFRSMVVNAPAVLDSHLRENPEAAREWNDTQKLKDDPRITPLGQVIRRLSVDELPQLINVMRGDMSIVGPRPVVTAELERYGEAVEAYMQVRPGLTGAWQVSGRSDVSYETRVALDTQYVRNWSMAEDIRIIAKTVPAVLTSKGSY